MRRQPGLDAHAAEAVLAHLDLSDGGAPILRHVFKTDRAYVFFISDNVVSYSLYVPYPQLDVPYILAQFRQLFVVVVLLM